MKTRTRKDVIKNIAIVFLAIMLVLTFFSNTILNWSLPQVSGKYSEYGDIKTGVRGSGTVISNMTYTESIKGLRTVEAVYVNRGSWVESGDLLMLLSATETDSIAALEAEIATMQEAYDRAILGRSETDYSSDELAIRNAEEDLAEIKAERAFYTDEYVAQVKKAAEDADKALETALEELEKLEEELEEISENSDQPEIVAAREAVEQQTVVYELAVAARERAEKALEALGYSNTDSLSSQLDSLYSQLEAIEKELKYLREDYAEPLGIHSDTMAKKNLLADAVRAYEKALAAYEKDNSTLPALQAAEQAKNEAQAAYDAALVIYNQNEEKIKEATRAVEAKQDSMETIEGEIYSVRQQLAQASTNNREYTNLKNTLELKKTGEETEKKNLEDKQKILADTVKKFNKTVSDKIKETNKSIEALTEEKAEADRDLSGLSVIEGLDAEIKSSERSLESMKLSLEQRKENDAQSDKLEEYDLNKQLKAIQDKKNDLAKLKGDSKEGYELRATHAGTVTEVNFRAGEIASDGAGAVVIEVQESGYTLSFSVNNSEAQKVKVGDTATVTDTYWGQNVGAVLKSIIPDAGGKTKTLTFELSGNANVGQTLTLLVGERTTGYSSVIPKSALHEDSKGKFIYITKTKSTPLGNRYVATRLDVTVAAEDDKNVAIVTDDTYLYEYVIITSTKPFEEGDYVRLSD